MLGKADVCIAGISLVYWASVLVFELSTTLAATYDAAFERDAVSVDSLPRISDVRPRLALEVPPDWLDAAPERESAAHETESYQVFPELPAREAARDAARLGGRHLPSALADRRSGGTGKRAHLREGPIGNPTAPVARGLWAIRAMYERAPRLAKESRAAGFTWWSPSVGGSGALVDWGPPDERRLAEEQVSAEWGEEQAAGDDDVDTLGNMFGPEPIDPRGSGLGAAGSGPGGSGSARRVGLGRSGELGHGSGHAAGQGVGVPDVTPFGRDASTGEHEPRAPRFSTRVPRDTVDRVLTRNSGRLATCRRGPEGIQLSFVITAEGTASDVALDAAEALPSSVRACMRRVLSELRFPVATTSARVVRWRLEAH